MIAQHPGLANPEISKIIGEQWQNQTVEVKNKWKALAEEEKLRHQQQYPSYRYQPKRNGRRGSISSDANGEKHRCHKCGGRSLVAPSAPFQHSNGASPASVPGTPGAVLTPVSRTLPPVFRELSIQSPAARRMGKSYHGNMPTHNGHYDERDDVGPLSPEMKRRKYSDHPSSGPRTISTRYVPAPGPPAGPGTPFPFSQANQSHPYPPAVAHARRESLPGIMGVVASPPGPMPPPPRPGMGYQQHRMSQGHIGPDRSLVLPPLQTGSISSASGAAAVAGKTAEEHIMSMNFRYKIKVLGQVAPPAPRRSVPRGPLIVVEGDNADAVAELGKWLSNELKKGDDLSVTMFDSPDLSAHRNKKPMVQYHLLATEWLTKTDEIVDALAYNPDNTPTDSAMSDRSPAREQAMSSRDIDENYDDSPKDQSRRSSGSGKAQNQESMDIDQTPTTAKPPARVLGSTKPVGLIANYSLHASNVFACRIPIGSDDPYSPGDHWQWTATQWRKVVGPDLTIFLRDAVVGETGKATVEILEEGNLFIVKRTKTSDGKALELDSSALRRLGFEVGEWVRAFGAEKRADA